MKARAHYPIGVVPLHAGLAGLQEITCRYIVDVHQTRHNIQIKGQLLFLSLFILYRIIILQYNNSV